MSAGLTKQHAHLSQMAVRPVGLSQVTLLDVAFADPVTYVDTTWTLHVTSDPAVAGFGTARVHVIRLPPGAAVPAITDAVLEGLDEDDWIELSCAYGASAGSALGRTRSKRAFKRNERLVIVAVFNHQLVAANVMVELMGRWMRVDA